MRPFAPALLGGLLACVAAAQPAAAAAPSPAPTAYRIDVTKIQPKALLPTKRLHDDFVVAINRKGQVTRVLAGHRSGNVQFDEKAYGNALQTFIRTTDGHVVVGKYQLSYDYDPRTARIRRTVALVSRGGVDPNAVGAVTDMLRHAHRDPAPILPAPGSGTSLNGSSLPSLKDVLGPSPKPH
jgi:hypothetical protein